ncbi:MAG: YXWGXW repeat-containing protein [Parvibaculaceae bacterium]
MILHCPKGCVSRSFKMKLNKSIRNLRLLSFAFPLMAAGLLATTALTVTATSAEAGVRIDADIFVPVAPPAPRVEIRPGPPGPQAVWVGGYWRWANRGHVWVPGRWQRPPPRRHEWVEGHWRHGHRGWV